MADLEEERTWLAAELSKALVDRNEDRFRTLAFWKRHVIIAALEHGSAPDDRYNPLSHPADCAYHVDQYPHECTCGRIRSRTQGNPNG